MFATRVSCVVSANSVASIRAATNVALSAKGCVSYMKTEYNVSNIMDITDVMKTVVTVLLVILGNAN